MTKLYGVLSQACGSLALALAVIALMTAASRNAFADEPTPGEPCACEIGETPEECAARCPIGCILTACPNNIPPCHTVNPGDLACVAGGFSYPQCPCFPGTLLPLCFCA